MKANLKKAVIIFLVVLSVLGMSGAFYLHMRQMDDLKQQTAFFTTFTSCAKQMPQDKTYVSFEDPANVPCFRKALKAGPDESFKFTLASLLVRQGRYDEARLIFVRIAHPDAFGLLFRRERTAAARQMLLPGAMQQAEAAMERSDQAQRDLVALSAKNNTEEQEFLRLHADVRNGVIIRMSDSDKALWLQMREQHTKEAAVLYRIRDGKS